MKTDSLRVSGVVAADPPTVFAAWLDSAGHTALSGAPATAEARVGGRFTAWDGYIEGTTLEIEPGRRIVQAWRTTEFPDGSADSRLEIRLQAVTGGTRVTFVHTEIPAGQGPQYASGWKAYYLEPMRTFFRLPQEAAATRRPKATKAAAKRVTAKNAETAAAKETTPPKKTAAAKKATPPKKTAAAKKATPPKKTAAAKKATRPKKAAAAKTATRPKKAAAAKKAARPKK